MSASLKFLFHVGFQNIQSFCLRHEPCGNAQNISIVVLLDQLGYFAVPRQASSHGLMFVGCHGDTVGGTANQDAEIHRSIGHIFRYRMSVIRVVHTFQGIRSPIDNFDTLGFQVCGQDLFQGRSSMITSY